jgi:hypothetical protein
MMFNVPIPGGSTGHDVGGAIIGIVLGPWAGVITISIALVPQALLFGDGGITAIAVNWFNMAVEAAQQLEIEIDKEKTKQEVSKVVESDYFKRIRSEGLNLRRNREKN